MVARKTLQGIATLGAIGGLGFAAGVTEALFPVLRRFEVPVLPAGADPIRILHISDMHLVPRRRRLIKFVRSLAGLDPDLVVTTGDNWATPRALDSVLEAYGPLLDVPGVFVFGSNDYYGPTLKNPLSYLYGGRRPPSLRELPADQLSKALSERGWVFLDDARTTVELNGLTVELRGTGDAHMQADDYEEVAGPASPGVDLSLGVTHAPYLRMLDAMANDGVRLVMAGHTHGGQVCLPIKGALVTNCDLPTSRAKGLFRHRTPLATTWVHVSAGLGTSPYAPYRLFCRPEASLLTLVARR